MYLNQSLKKYLDQLASDQPVPGGGGTSALVAALGISLILMVSRIMFRRLNAGQQKRMSRTMDLLEHLRVNAQQAIDLDPKVYQEVMNSYQRLKQLNHSKKAQKEVEAALANSFRLQADLALLIAMAKELLKTVGSFAKGSIANDLIVARGLLDGAFGGACATARINVVYMKSEKQKVRFEQALRKVENKYKNIQLN